MKASPFEANKKSIINSSPGRFEDYVNGGTASISKSNSLNQRSLSRTMLRSTGKYAVSSAIPSHQSSHIDVRSAFNATMDNAQTNIQCKKSPFGLKTKEFGVIRLDELEGLRMRASGFDDKTLNQMEQTKAKMEL
jgi:hypothetical protein